MNQRKLGILVAVVVVLVAIYAATSPDRNRPSHSGDVRLLSAVETERVEKVRIEQGDQVVELKVDQGNWSVPARGGYRADSSKVRSLLLKLFDLSVSQKLPAGDNAFDGLGLSDEAIKRGQSRITFFDKSDQVLGGVRIGEPRKSKSSGSASGQYIRTLDGKDVYLAALPLALTVTPNYWLDQNVVNVLPAHLRSIELYSSSDGASRLEYILKRVGEGKPGTTPSFELQNASIPEGKSLQESSVGLARAGLENVRLHDVFSKDSAEVKELRFDVTTIYRLENGLVYTVESAEKDNRFFARFAVQFDPAVGAEVEKFNKGVEEELAKLANEAKPSDGKSADAKPAEPAAAEKKVPEKKPLSSEKEAEAQRAQLGNWIFELPPYQGKKLRQHFDDLVKVPEKPAGQGGSLPQELQSPEGEG